MGAVYVNMGNYTDGKKYLDYGCKNGQKDACKLLKRGFADKKTKTDLDGLEIPSAKFKQGIGNMDAEIASVFWNSCLNGYVDGLKAQKYTLQDLKKINFAWVGNYCYNLLKQLSTHPESSTDAGLQKLFASDGFADKLNSYKSIAIKEADKKFSRYNKAKPSKKVKDDDEIKPYSIDKIANYPKIKKGMSKAELLEKFGRPIRVSDDGKAVYFKSKKFCSNSFTHECVAYFSGKDSEGVTSWSDFNFEYTDNLKD